MRHFDFRELAKNYRVYKLTQNFTIKRKNFKKKYQMVVAKLCKSLLQSIMKHIYNNAQKALSLHKFLKEYEPSSFIV